MTVPLYLASTSPARLSVLRASGIEPVIVPSEVDEPACVEAAARSKGRPLTTGETVALLAQAKAEAIVSRVARDGLILGGDSAFALGGETLGKPHTPEVATARIKAMSGASGILHSGHWLIDARTGLAAGAVATATVTFDRMSDDEIAAYVATGEPLEVAGAFTLDGRGSAFIESIAGDPSCVIGVSVPTVRRLAAELGVAWQTLWNRA